MQEHIILNKKLAAIDKKMERLYQQRDRLREERAQLCDEYIKTHQLVPEAQYPWHENVRGAEQSHA